MILVDNNNSTNPYINLAIEEFLLRSGKALKTDLLFLYINEPCVVLGKNQSIYKEINFEYLKSGKLKLARRITGGGTVYQDPGNLNFSFLSEFRDFKVNNYRHFNEPVVNALNKAGLAAQMDERNNILVGYAKVSGNAQFTDRKTIISHGTLLFDANINDLRACLKRNPFQVDTRAVNSVPQAVTNIKVHTNTFDSINSLKDYLIQHLASGEVLQFNDAEWKTITQLAREKFESYEWIYGRTPLTTITKNDLSIVVESGIIQQINAAQNNLSFLTGVKYEYQSLKAKLEEQGFPELLPLVFA